MALPNYESTGQPFSFQAAGYNQHQWRDLPRQRRGRIRRGWGGPPQPQQEQGGQQPQFPYTYGQPVNPSSDLSGHPFFDPNSNYAANGRSYGFAPNSTAYQGYATEKTPEGYYFGLLNERGLGGFDARSQAAQSMYGDYARGYQAAKLKNMELWWPEFMQGQNIQGTLDLMSNDQLGIDNSNIQGRDRWSFRSQ